MLDMPLTFDENDPARRDKEALLRALKDEDLRALYWQTRDAARNARDLRDMERLFAFVRGTKTIQRIAAERGMVIRATR